DVVAELELVEEDVQVETVAPFVVDEPPVAEESVDHPVRTERQVLDYRADGARLAGVCHQVEVREEGSAFPHPADAVKEREAFGDVEGMRVDAERAEDAQGGAFGVRCIHDFSGLPQELFIAEGEEF